MSKPVHTIILDSGPIIKNEPSVSSLLAQSESIVTSHAVIAEIRDSTTRARTETTLLPFLTLRSPHLESIRTVTDFARRTGDLAVLSGTDLQVLALAYELECERNGGDWRLRRTPGQKGLNGSPPTPQQEDVSKATVAGTQSSVTVVQDQPESQQAAQGGKPPIVDAPAYPDQAEAISDVVVSPEDVSSNKETAGVSPINQAERGLSELEISPAISTATDESERMHGPVGPAHLVESDESLEGSISAANGGSDAEADAGGWITLANIDNHRDKHANVSLSKTSEPKTMQVATITTDFAMQNVLLRMNLNLLSASLQRVKHLRTFILRCHACFMQTKDMTKQFCPRCGKPALTRVACSTNQNGEFTLHLKKNMQWNKRGDRYSIPKPVSGHASGRVNVGGGGKGGGKNGWGQDLILVEDQKEYLRAMGEQKRTKERDLMDQDYLPTILTGERGRNGGRPKVGAGRNVNSRKK